MCSFRGRHWAGLRLDGYHYPSAREKFSEQCKSYAFPTRRAYVSPTGHESLTDTQSPEMPSGIICTGGPNGDACVVRCRNAAIAGPFGGCVAGEPRPAASIQHRLS